MKRLTPQLCLDAKQQTDLQKIIRSVKAEVRMQFRASIIVDQPAKLRIWNAVWKTSPKNKFEFHYTPLHASWVNQVEIFFSILQKRCLKWASFDSTEELQEKVMAFIQRWNKLDSHPFNWTFRGYPMQSKEKEAA